MAATRQDIDGWFERGKADKQQFLIIACDTYDWDDYPIFCSNAKEFAEKYASHNEVNMQTIMEVYDLTKDKVFQMNQNRCYSYPEGFKP